MADVITRLKLESGEYDSKIKRATQGLLQMEEECRKVGGTLAILEDEQKQYVQSLGQMDTVSRNVRGKLAELTAAYTELRVQYERLTEEEKQGDYGRALSSSLDQLKARIGETKSQLNEAGKEINNSGGLLDNLASKFVVNIDAMKLFNMGLSAATGALDVVKDAFFNNEQNLDEWGRTVEASHSLYNGFLNALNTGNIGGYLSNIDKIVEAARRAYNALDELNTFNAFNQINVEKTRTGLTESIVDYRGGSGTKEAVKAAGDAYKKELQDRKRLEKDAYLEAVGKVAAERGVSKQDLLDALGGSYGHYQDLKNVQETGERIVFTSGGMFGGSVGVKTKYAQTREEQLGVALRHLNDTEIQNLQALGAQAERTGNEIAQVDKQITRVLNGRQPGAGGSSGGGGTRGGRTTAVTEVLPVGSVAALTKQMQELQKAQQLVTNTNDWKNYQYQIDAVIKSIDKLKGITTVSDRFNTIMAAGDINPADLNRQSVSQMALGGLDLANIPLERRKEWLGLSQTPSMQPVQFETPSTTEQLDKISNSIDTFTGGISKIFSGLSAMGVELPKELIAVINAIQGVSSIITGVGTLIELFSTTSHTANTAAVAGNTIALTANTAALASVSAALAANTTTNFLPFANGGVVHAAGGVIVPGNHRSGDMVPAMLNSGEVVLNAAQAANLSSILQSGAGENLNLTATISGEQIRLALNNNSRRRGRGEYVTSNTIR